MLSMANEPPTLTEKLLVIEIRKYVYIILYHSNKKQQFLSMPAKS